jgi:hypothetical protein
MRHQLLPLWRNLPGELRAAVHLDLLNNACTEIEYRAQADWTFILRSEVPAPLAEKNAAAGYQTSQYVVPRVGIFLGKRRSTFA